MFQKANLLEKFVNLSFGPKDDLMELVTELQHWVYHYSKEPEVMSLLLLSVYMTHENRVVTKKTPIQYPLVIPQKISVFIFENLNWICG